MYNLLRTYETKIEKKNENLTLHKPLEHKHGGSSIILWELFTLTLARKRVRIEGENGGGQVQDSPGRKPVSGWKRLKTWLEGRLSFEWATTVNIQAELNGIQYLKLMFPEAPLPDVNSFISKD